MVKLVSQTGNNATAIVLCIFCLLIIIGAVVVTLTIVRFFEYEQYGLATRSAYSAVYDHVQSTKTWPKSWEDLPINKRRRSELESLVSIDFGRTINEAHQLLEAESSLIVPKRHALSIYDTERVRLKGLVQKIVQEYPVNNLDSED